MRISTAVMREPYRARAGSSPPARLSHVVLQSPQRDDPPGVGEVQDELQVDVDRIQLLRKEVRRRAAATNARRRNSAATSSSAGRRRGARSVFRRLEGVSAAGVQPGPLPGSLVMPASRPTGRALPVQPLHQVEQLRAQPTTDLRLHDIHQHLLAARNLASVRLRDGARTAFEEGTPTPRPAHPGCPSAREPVTPGALSRKCRRDVLTALRCQHERAAAIALAVVSLLPARSVYASGRG